MSVCKEGMDSQRVLMSSLLRDAGAWRRQYASVSEFKHDLEEEDEEGALGQEELNGWVFWRENEVEQHPILTLLKSFASAFWVDNHYLIQFWGVVEVEGRNHYLSTSNYPFFVSRLNQGNCRYRNRCRGLRYVVGDDDDDDDHDDQEQQQQLIGGVGRAYRKKQPESTPDLRLYSTNEFTMRDEAARCGFRYYLALPLFHSQTNTSQCCYGVLELLSDEMDTISRLDRALQNAGLRSTHNPILSRSGSPEEMQQQQLDREIRERLELVMATVPRLYLALVWVPCKQCCVNMVNTNLRCMEIHSLFRIGVDDDDCAFYGDYYDDVAWDYHVACKLHNLQIDVSSSFSSNLCDVSMSISENPLAHYAQRARLSHSLAILLQSLNNSNHLYLIQFFLLQPKLREDDTCALLLRIMKMNLKTFKLVQDGSLVAEPQNPNAIACESIDSLKVIKSYTQKFLESNFTNYLNTDDSCCLRPSYSVSSDGGWVFRRPLLVPIGIEEKKDNFMKNIVANIGRKYWILQFWAPKMEGGRCYLQASDQPYAIGCLTKGVALFRKKCILHHYVVDDEAKEEELGPPGRVFRNGHPEISPDLYHYTAKEYPIRNYAMHCCNFSRGYFVLPIFDDDDEHSHKCVGVLEFLGFYDSDLERIAGALKEAKLCSAHIDFYPRFLSDEQPVNTIYCRKEALTELRNALKLICNNIPQLHIVQVWVPNGECFGSVNSNTSCMELAWSNIELDIFKLSYEVKWIHVRKGKGMVGMALSSENKSCLCRNLCEFSIVDQPLSHFEMSDRSDVCFAICLQSSHTGDLVYVVEFFLYHGPTAYEYLRSLFNFLMLIMKHKLKSFKMASGKELGEELVVDVIEFSHANTLDFSSESEEAGVFPIKFKSVQYSREEHQHREQQTEECIVVASDSKIKERGKRKTGLNLSLEDLKPHFGKKLQDVELELGVGRSTIKRACRDYGIDRWPTKGKYKKNPSLFQRKSGRDSQSTHHAIIVEEEAEKVMIKVISEEDIIKFELCLSLGLAKLIEEVSTRLNLEKGAFKLKYSDEDGDEILLTNDADLQLCRKTQITMNKTYIQLFVRL